jgi:hypothetical protein
MKFYISLIAFLFFSFSNQVLLGQTYLEVQSDTIYGSKQEFDGINSELFLKTILDSRGSAEDLYSKSYNFILTRYNYDKSKILNSKKGEFLIFEHVEENLISYKTLMSTKEMKLRFQIRLDFRDNRFKWEVTALEGFFENDLFDQSVQEIIGGTGAWVSISKTWKTTNQNGKSNIWTNENFENLRVYFESLIKDHLSFIKNSVNTKIDESNDDW